MRQHTKIVNKSFLPNLFGSLQLLYIAISNLLSKMYKYLESFNQFDAYLKSLLTSQTMVPVALAH